MPETSGLEPSTHTVASSLDQNGDYRKRDPDADKISSNKNIVDRVYLEDAEKGSPPSHPPHVVKDGGLAAWGTALGAYVE